MDSIGRDFDFRGALDAAVDRLEVLTGYRLDPTTIGEDQTFLEWCLHLAKSGPDGKGGMKIDGKPFNLDERPALIPLYESIPKTPTDARGFMLSIMKGSQIGLTVWEVLACIYMAKKWEPLTIGMYMPDQATASYKSNHRFMRIVRSVKALYRGLVTRLSVEGEKENVGEGNILTRTMGESIFLFLWTSGKVTTESRPMDVVSLDEVQEMTGDQISKAHQRTGDSHIDFKILLSTANIPGEDIDRYYKLGSQEDWHSHCPTCGEYSDLSDPTLFPKSVILYNTGQVETAPLHDYCWVCPRCSGWIENPQMGKLIARFPDRMPYHRSFHLPRMISPRTSARKAWEGWRQAKTPDEKKSFFNRYLGWPYLDPSQQPVTIEHCEACVEAGRLAGVVWKQNARDTFMGIDQMGSFNVVIIKERLTDGRQAVIHVEAIYSHDPFERCAQLMVIYGVAVCVVEQLPNVNDARRFANRFRKRVFLAGYADLKDDFMTWGDALSDSDYKTKEDERTRYSVTLNQYKCMQVALHRIRDAHCLFPDPDALLQPIPDGDVNVPQSALRMAFDHFTKTALMVEQDPETRKPRARVIKVSLDPHFSYANMLCDVGWARSYGNSTFILPQGNNDREEKRQAAVERNMPGLPVNVVSMMRPSIPAGDVCGRCLAFDAKHSLCTERHLIVQAVDPGCELFIPKEES